MEHHDKVRMEKGLMDVEKTALEEVIELLKKQMRMEEALIRLYEETKGHS